MAHNRTTFKPVNLFEGDQPVHPGLTCNVASCVKSKSLRVCARCKMASYCSKECQTADWKVHKIHCLKRKHIPDSVVPLHVWQLHERLFADFREAHSMLLTSMLRYIVECAGGAKTFDYSSLYVHVLSEFNEQSEFNPATAYRVDTFLLADLGTFKRQDAYKGQDAHKALHMRLEADDATFRATKPEYQGSLVMVVWVKLGALTMDFMQTFPIFGAGSGFDERDFEEALRLINDGLVVRDVKGKKLFGRIAKEGDKWRWRRLPGAAADLSSYGMSWGKVN